MAKFIDYSLVHEFKLTKVKSVKLVKRAERAGYECELEYLINELKKIIEAKTK